MPFPVIVARVIADAFPLILVSSHVIPVIPFQGRRRRRRRALSWLRRYIAPLGQNRRTTRGQWPIYRVVGSNDDPLICPFTGNNPLSFPFRVSCCRSAEHDYYVYIDTSSCVRACVCVLAVALRSSPTHVNELKTNSFLARGPRIHHPNTQSPPIKALKESRSRTPKEGAVKQSSP